MQEEVGAHARRCVDLSNLFNENKEGYTLECGSKRLFILMWVSLCVLRKLL